MTGGLELTTASGHVDDSRSPAAAEGDHQLREDPPAGHALSPVNTGASWSSWWTAAVNLTGSRTGPNPAQPAKDSPEFYADKLERSR